MSAEGPPNEEQLSKNKTKWHCHSQAILSHDQLKERLTRDMRDFYKDYPYGPILSIDFDNDVILIDSQYDDAVVKLSKTLELGMSKMQ